jgi:hypothetical protein
MTDESSRPQIAAFPIAISIAVVGLSDAEVEVLHQWVVAETAVAAEHSKVEPALKAERLRTSAKEIGDLVANRQSLVADDLEERMINLLLADLEPSSQWRLELERDIAQVTAAKDHIEGTELLGQLAAIATKTWRAHDNRENQLNLRPLPPAGSTSTSPALQATPTPSNQNRVRPIPRPTPIEPRKRGLLDRLLGRK